MHWKNYLLIPLVNLHLFFASRNLNSKYNSFNLQDFTVLKLTKESLYWEVLHYDWELLKVRLGVRLHKMPKKTILLTNLWLYSYLTVRASVMLLFAFNICFLKSSRGTKPTTRPKQNVRQTQAAAKKGEYATWQGPKVNKIALIFVPERAQQTYMRTYSCNFIPWQFPGETSSMFLDMFCESGTLKEGKKRALQQLHKLHYLCESQVNLVNLMCFFLLTSETSG